MEARLQAQGAIQEDPSVAIGEEGAWHLVLAKAYLRSLRDVG